MEVPALLALCLLYVCALTPVSTTQQNGKIPISMHNILPDWESIGTHEKSSIVAFDTQDQKVINSTLVQTRHKNNLTLTIRMGDETFILDLYLNSLLIASNYTEIKITKNGKYRTDVDLYASHCYYIGVVRGYVNSTAAVSTCSGIYGAFYAGDESYFISPESVDEGCLSCPHRLYKSSDQPELLKKLGCGGGVEVPSTSRAKRAVIDEWPQDLDGKTRVVEMYIVNDNSQYNKYLQNQASVTERAMTVVNVASALYHKYDIYIVIVGQEVWADYDMVPVGDGNGRIDDSNTLLWNFCSYKRYAISTPHDTAFLLTASGPFDAPSYSTLGRSFTGALCGEYGCGVIADYSVPPAVGQLIAHELGHNFGLIHDWDYPESRMCQCNDKSGSCIMGQITQATEFSSCSESELTSKGNYASFSCLYNIPDTVYSKDTPAVCGNGIVEAGEQCDCGKAPITECNPNCCNSVTCQLTSSAQCASGRCCNIDYCSYKPKYTKCRDSKGSCDLDEYCSGSTDVCPDDFFKPNLTQCDVESAPGFCSNGVCRNRNNQCVTMYGSGSSSGSDSCYTTFNTAGNIDGNCGFASSTDLYNYVPCSTQDILCGTLQCQGGGAAQVYGQIYDVNKTTSTGDKCRSMKFDFKPSRNLGFTMDGSYCGTGKVCQDFKCIPVESAYSYSVLGSCGNCNGNGVCNNLGKCHCNAGFAPPFCSGPGEGGSLDSNGIGPSPNSTISYPFTSTPTINSTNITTTTMYPNGTRMRDTSTLPTFWNGNVSSHVTLFDTTTTTSPRSPVSNYTNTMTRPPFSWQPFTTNTLLMNGTTSSPCTAALNCGFGGDGIVIAAIVIGGLLLLLFSLFACTSIGRNCFSPRPRPSYAAAMPQNYPQLQQVPHLQLQPGVPGVPYSQATRYYNKPRQDIIIPAVYGKSAYEISPTYQVYWNPPV